MATRVLVVEDDAVIADAVVETLERAGYATCAATNLFDAALAAHSWGPDLVLLDLTLPDGDGITLCRRLRAQYPQLRIIIVTARDEDLDVVVGLDAGANDYVTKPFAVSVLLARLRAHLRVTVAGSCAPLTVSTLSVRPTAHQASLGGVPLDLRPREFAVLALLVRERGRVVTHERILAELWGLNWDKASRKSLETHIHTLRRKLGISPHGPAWISTVRSIGYRFEAP